MAFIGVRISWLILLKNCCFAFTASSAICVLCSALLFAFKSSFFAITASVISMPILIAPIISPFNPNSGCGCINTCLWLPLGLSIINSPPIIARPSFKTIAIGDSFAAKDLPLMLNILYEPEYNSLPILGLRPQTSIAASL